MTRLPPTAPGSARNSSLGTDDARAATPDSDARANTDPFADHWRPQPMTHDSAISTVGLTKHFPGVAALTDLSLEVPAGSIYGFLGPNGAGKTTTLKILAGLTTPTSGTASVAGIPVAAGAGYRRQVGFLAQE